MSNSAIRQDSVESLCCRSNGYWKVRIEALEDRITDVNVIGAQILRAVRTKTGFALIRLGDTELLILAQRLVFPVVEDVTEWGDCMAALCGDPHLGCGDNEVFKWKSILDRSGVGFPDSRAQKLLIEAIRSADVIGVPSQKRPGRSRAHVRLVGGFQAAMLAAFDRLGLAERDLKLTDCGAHYLLHEAGWVRRFLGIDRIPLSTDLALRAALIGNRAAEYAKLLQREDVRVTCTVSPVQGVDNVDQVIAQLDPRLFDIAFVSAGTAAKYICTTIARRFGKVAIDTGQLFDHVLKRFNGSMSISRYIVPWRLML